MKNKLLIAIAALLFISLTSAAVYFYVQYRQVTSDETKKAERLIKTLSKFVQLPSDEVPTVATVADKTKLDNNPFLNQAENGDMIVIYSQDGKAILYRPSEEKIIDMTRINISNDSQQMAGEGGVEFNNRLSENEQKTIESEEVKEELDEKQEKIAKVLLLNGTETAGLTGPVEEDLVAEFDNIEITDRQPAGSKDYNQTYVINVSGKFTDLTSQIADYLGSEQTTLDEDFDDVDIVVVVGKDKI